MPEHPLASTVRHPSPERRAWRLLLTPAAPGAWNMAVDEAILEAAAAGRVLPTLRLYAWEPTCLSLGYAQPYTDADLAALHANGWQLVRRPTGGRAILHTDELTYSVAGPQQEPHLAGGVLQSYRILSAGLLHALRLLGLPAEAHTQAEPAAGSDPKGPVCFEVPSNYEITLQGRKLVGSAQSRRLGGVLQHGSLPLGGDLGRITQALTFPDEAARRRAAERLSERAVTVEAATGRALTWEQAAAAFRQGFAEALLLDLQPGELSQQESRRAEQLVREKYSHARWNQRIVQVKS